jgi:hypothetical protein
MKYIKTINEMSEEIIDDTQETTELKQYIPTLKAVNLSVNKQTVIDYLNTNDVDYIGWNDIEMYIYYIENN